MQPSEMTEHRTPIRSSLGDDPDFRELLELFSVSIQETTEKLRSLLAASDVQQIQREAHKLKGAGGGYGFEGLTAEAAALESACKARDLDQIRRTLDSLLNYVSRIEV